MSTDVAVLLLDIEAAVQTARLSSHRRYEAQAATNVLSLDHARRYQ